MFVTRNLFMLSLLLHGVLSLCTRSYSWWAMGCCQWRHYILVLDCSANVTWQGDSLSSSAWKENILPYPRFEVEFTWHICAFQIVPDVTLGMTTDVCQICLAKGKGGSSIFSGIANHSLTQRDLLMVLLSTCSWRCPTWMFQLTDVMAALGRHTTGNSFIFTTHCIGCVSCVCSSTRTLTLNSHKVWWNAFVYLSGTAVCRWRQHHKTSKVEVTRNSCILLVSTALRCEEDTYRLLVGFRAVWEHFTSKQALDLSEVSLQKPNPHSNFEIHVHDTVKQRTLYCTVCGGLQCCASAAKNTDK